MTFIFLIQLWSPYPSKRCRNCSEKNVVEQNIAAIAHFSTKAQALAENLRLNQFIVLSQLKMAGYRPPIKDLSPQPAPKLTMMQVANNQTVLGRFDGQPLTEFAV
jgi:hypothetical protein